MMCRLKVNKIVICDYYFFVRCRRSPISHHHMVLVWSPIKRRKIPFWVCLFHTHTCVCVGCIYIYVCTRAHALFITLGPSPRPSDRDNDQVNQPRDPTLCACIGRSPRAPAHPSRSAPRVSTEPIGSTRPDRADAALIKWIGPAHTRPHTAQPFFSVAQSLYYTVSHFAAMNPSILLH
jgi:hypothetical protein